MIRFARSRHLNFNWKNILKCDWFLVSLNPFEWMEVSLQRTLADQMVIQNVRESGFVWSRIVSGKGDSIDCITDTYISFDYGIYFCCTRRKDTAMFHFSSIVHSPMWNWKKVRPSQRKCQTNKKSESSLFHLFMMVHQCIIMVDINSALNILWLRSQ